MYGKKDTKNSIIAELEALEKADPEEEESLKELYRELDLTYLNLIIIDFKTSKENISKIPSGKLQTEDNLYANFIPYGGELRNINGLNKEMSFSELRDRILVEVKWPFDTLRLWDHLDYEQFLNGNGDPFSRSPYRCHFPKPIDIEDDTLIFPMFVSGQHIIAERIEPVKYTFPKSAFPIVHTRESWWKELYSDWDNNEPPLDKTIYQTVQIVSMPRKTPPNSLFNGLGYLLHNIGCVKGVEIDEDEKGITQASHFRAPHMRKTLARFVVDYSEEILQSGLLTDIDEYIKNVLDPNYPGSDIDIILTAIMSGVIIQVFSVPSHKMLEYGKGFVEKYGSPFRLGPKYTIKLAKWKDNEYDPITFCIQLGTDPERFERPFCFAFTIYAFDWMKNQSKDQMLPFRLCNHCGLIESNIKEFSYCGHCRLVFYCSRKCQVHNWKREHASICQKRNHILESKQSDEDELNAFESLKCELEMRKKNEIGSRKWRYNYEKCVEDYIITNKNNLTKSNDSIVSNNEKISEIEIINGISNLSINDKDNNKDSNTELEEETVVFGELNEKEVLDEILSTENKVDFK